MICIFVRKVRKVIMKRLVSFFLVLAIIATLSIGALSTSAETIDDIVKKFTDKSPIAKYIAGDVKNLAKSVKFTDDQLKEVSNLVDEFLALGITDRGPSADKYPKSQQTAVLKLLDKFCANTGFRYEVLNTASPKHTGDIKVKLYDNNNKLIYVFDGDIVSKTGLNEEANTALPLAVGSACIVFAGIFAVIAAKSGKKEGEAA